MNVADTIFIIFAKHDTDQFNFWYTRNHRRKRGYNLTPVDVIRFTSAYGVGYYKKHQKGTVVVGRDARPSGAMIQELGSANTYLSRNPCD